MKLPKAEADLLVLEALSTASAGNAGWLRADCPFCLLNGQGSADTHASWGFHEASGKWHCFRCAEKGYLHSESNVDDAPVIPDFTEFVEPPESFVELASEEGRQARTFERVRRYLLGRGLSWKTLAETRIGTCSQGRYAGRVVVPVLASSGKGWVGFLSRIALSKAELKAAEAVAAEETPPRRILRYANHPGEWRKGILYNQAALSVETDEPVGVFEGVFSAFPAWPDCVACLGKPTETQRDLLLGSKRPLAVCLDGDAWEEGEALALWLRFQGKQAGFVHFPPKQDANDLPVEWVREQMRTCIERPIT